MKVNKISRRAFLLGLGAVSAAALLSACGGSASSSSCLLYTSPSPRDCS